MHRSTVETVLEYEIQAPTHFCFNIEAANWPTQKIVSERLAVSSGVSVHSFTDPGSGNRFFRFDASPGPLLVDYKADVEVFILDEVFASLPSPPFTPDEKKALAASVYVHVWQQAVSGGFARAA